MISPADLAQTESGVESFGYLADDEPSPDEMTVFTSELERFMDTLEEPAHRLILLWKLEDRTNPEIARYLDCSISTVERSLRQIRKRLGGEIDSIDS